MKEISTFVTPDAFLNDKVMAFVMHNTPACFQRLVNIVLSGVARCDAYLDDVVLCTVVPPGPNIWPSFVKSLRDCQL